MSQYPDHSLVGLPAEIKRMILGYLLIMPPGSHHWEFPRKGSNGQTCLVGIYGPTSPFQRYERSLHPAILRAHPTYHSAGAPLLYAENIFHLLNIANARNFLCQIINQNYASMIRHLIIDPTAHGVNPPETCSPTGRTRGIPSILSHVPGLHSLKINSPLSGKAFKSSIGIGSLRDIRRVMNQLPQLKHVHVDFLANTFYNADRKALLAIVRRLGRSYQDRLG